MEESSKPKRMVLDTSVLVEYIVERAPYRLKVEKLFESAARGDLELYVSPITLSETIYVASRIYSASSLPNPNEEALNYVEWLKGRLGVVEITGKIAMRAGELKKILHMALADCYVIATAEELNAKPLFKRIEKEMESVINRLEDLGVTFLDQI